MTTLRGGFFQTARPQSVILLEDFLNNLPKYLSLKKVPSDKPGVVYPFNEFNEGLSECSCEAFERKGNDSRKIVEELIIQEIEKRFSHTKKSKVPLKILSFASGRLLQDFIICAKLLLLGYSIDIIFIDKDIENLSKALNTFRLLNIPANDLDLKLRISKYQYLSDYVSSNPEKNIQIAHAIDLDYPEKSFSSLCQIKHLLSQEGFFLFTLRHNRKYAGSLMYMSDAEGCDFYKGFTSVPDIQSTTPFRQFVNIPYYVKSYDEKCAKDTKTNISSFFQSNDRVIKTVLSYRDFLEMGGIFAEKDRDLQELEKNLGKNPVDLYSSLLPFLQSLLGNKHANVNFVLKF